MLSVGMVFSLQITGQDIYSTATYAPPARTDLSQLAPLSSVATSHEGNHSSAASENNDEDDEEEAAEEESSEDETGDDDEENAVEEVEGENATAANDNNNDDDDENDPGASGHLDSENEGGDVDPGIGFHRRQVRRANTVAVAATYAHADHATRGGGGENESPPSAQHRGGVVRGTNLGIENVVVAGKG